MVCINIEEVQSSGKTVVVSQLSGQTILILWCMDLAEPLLSLWKSIVWAGNESIYIHVLYVEVCVYLRVLTQLMATGPHARMDACPLALVMRMCFTLTMTF